MNNISFDKKIEGAVRGGAIGDALGLTVEMKTKKEIFDKIGKIKEYLPIRNHDLIGRALLKGKKLGFNINQTGIISDDTIFTIAGMDSISKKGNLEVQDLFDTYSFFFHQYKDIPFRGKTAEKFKNYTIGGNLSILYSKSWGNGAFMKQFPYSAYYYTIQKKIKKYKSEILIDNTISKITSITHDTAIAKIISILHNRVLIYLLNTQPDDFDAHQLLGYLQSIAPIWEDVVKRSPNHKEYNSDSDMLISPIIEKLIQQQHSIDQGHPYSYDDIIHHYLVNLDESKDVKINKSMKPGFHVASTFGFVYACFLQNQNFQGLLDSIQIGYDTDSQAAVIGNMIGALHGPFYDESYKDGLQEKDTIQDAIDKFQTTLSKKAGD